MIKTNIRPLNTHTLSGNVSTQTGRHISTGTVSGDSGQNEITSNIQPTDTHSLDGNITTQSQHQISTAGMSANIETDPIFRHSVAYNITQTDVDNWNAAYNVDMDEYVSKVELVEQSYVTSDTLDAASYVTQSALDAAAYVTHEFLSAQAYLTSVEFPDYSNTYQAKGDYITPTDLDNAAYITNETDPIFSASPAAGITEQDIQNWNNGAGIDLSSYVTYEYLSAQAYLTSVVFPDYSNTYQTKGNYVTQEVLTQQAYLTTETDPVFGASPAASITDTDIANWNAAAGTIDMSAYVTKNELVAQSYITSVTFPDYSNTYQAKGNYLTTETDPVFSASPAAGITAQDIQNWNNGSGVDLSSYVTYEFLSSQAYITPAQLYNMSYITINDVVFPDYSNTYQAKGDYVTVNQLSAQSYLTSETDPIFSASPAAGITATDIANWNSGAGIDFGAYVTHEFLSAQAYLTSVVFPDYSNTYQTKGDYVTKSQLSAQSYLTNADMSAYVTKITDTSQYVQVRKLTNDTRGELSLMVYDENDFWTRSELDLQNDYVQFRILDNSKPWWYSGNMWIGAYDVHINGIKTISIGTGMSVGGITYTPKTTIGNAYLNKGYIKYGSNNQYVPIASYTYVVEKINQYPASTITTTDIANWNAAAGTIDMSAYVMKSELVAQSYLTSETDPIFSASPAATITTSDIQNWNNGGSALNSYVSYNYLSAQSYVTSANLSAQSYITQTSLSSQSYITQTNLSAQSYVTQANLSAQSYVTQAVLSNCGYVQIQLVTQAQYVDRQDNILYIITDAPPIS